MKTKIINHHIDDGCGTGKNSGLYIAEKKLKKEDVGTVIVLRFLNGYATFIKASDGVRAITEDEIKKIKSEKD